jgi:hypothetical protein
MISIGVYYGGPEQHSIKKLFITTMKAVVLARGDKYELHHEPSVNIVFYVPGSLNSYADLKKIEAARFSRKQKLLLVAVPVPKNVALSGGSIEFVIDSLSQAIEVAAKTFLHKGVEQFDMINAKSIVEQVKHNLQQALQHNA